MRRRRRFFALAEGALILVFLVLAAIIANRLLAARWIREEERAAAEAHRSLAVSVTAVPEKSDFLTAYVAIFFVKQSHDNGPPLFFLLHNPFCLVAP